MTMITGTRNYQALRLVLPEQKRLRSAFDTVAYAAGFGFEKSNARAALGQFIDKEEKIKPVTAFELRADAALDWLSDGSADLALVGADMLAEYTAANPNAPISPVLSLERISRCSLWIAAKPEIYIRSIEDLGEMRLASAYPAFLQQWLQQNGVRPGRILAQKGNVEAALVAGRADAILEVVETGASLAANGLEKKLLAFNSHAVLVRNTAPFSSEAEAVTRSLAIRLKHAETASTPAQPLDCTPPSGREGGRSRPLSAHTLSVNPVQP